VTPFNGHGDLSLFQRVEKSDYDKKNAPFLNNTVVVAKLLWDLKLIRNGKFVRSDGYFQVESTFTNSEDKMFLARVKVVSKFLVSNLKQKTRPFNNFCFIAPRASVYLASR
jgi:hypothetical protein